MNTQQIWQHIFQKKVALSHPFDRDFVWINKHDFVLIEKYFIKEFNPLQIGTSYRSNNYFKHIHAVEQEKYFFVHFDHGNIRKCFPLIIIHFFIDVLPYFIFCLLKRKRFDYFFTPIN